MKKNYANENTELPRSKLYNISPLGMGTSNSESLTSYITRLANAHLVSVHDLLLYEIVPKLGKYQLKDELGKTKLCCGIYRRSYLANGTKQFATSFIEVISELTSRKDLNKLSLHPFKDVFSNYGLLRTTKAWCPECLSLFREKGVMIEPLTWIFKDYVACSKHNIRLVEFCPHCNSALLYLNGPCIEPGFCYKCRAFLGDHQEVIQVNEDSIELWKAQNIADLISTLPDINNASLTQERLILMLTFCNQYLKNSNRGYPKAKALPSKLNWLKRKGEPPRLDFILNIIYASSLTLTEFFLKPMETLHVYDEKALSKKPIYRTQLKKRIGIRKHDRIATEIRLKEYLGLDEPISFGEVARQLGQHPKTLVENYPDISKNLIGKYKNWRLQKKIRDIEKVYDEVAIMISDFKQRGITPSRAQIQANIPRPIVFREAIYRKAYFDLIVKEYDEEGIEEYHDD